MFTAEDQRAVLHLEAAHRRELDALRAEMAAMEAELATARQERAGYLRDFLAARERAERAEAGQSFYRSAYHRLRNPNLTILEV